MGVCSFLPPVLVVYRKNPLTPTPARRMVSLRELIRENHQTTARHHFIEKMTDIMKR
ncbi:hypothetical protein U14_05066 [Candidatus Moduliflexus flocculans]|uniref:Uncharacterized protein n=1 Tax=Candidatus Moduliflexus flocculans TaxID=1499966 RepID=A0A081BQW1_9BACT|nr:hypothetical protein U14_05066 [Candidatus Moduliflexus flocculans]